METFIALINTNPYWKKTFFVTKYNKQDVKNFSLFLKKPNIYQLYQLAFKKNSKSSSKKGLQIFSGFHYIQSQSKV